MRFGQVLARHLVATVFLIQRFHRQHVEIQDIPQVIDAKTGQAVCGPQNQAHRRLPRHAPRHVQAGSQVDRHDNLAPQVDQTVDDVGRQRDPCRRHGEQGLLHMVHLHSEMEPIDEERAVLSYLGHRLLPTAGSETKLIPHARANSRISTMSITRPPISVRPRIAD